MAISEWHQHSKLGLGYLSPSLLCHKQTISQNHMTAEYMAVRDPEPA